MPPILPLLSLLSYLVALTSAITPARIPHGGVAEGYFGNWRRAYDGDLLVTTNCHCAIPPPLHETRADRANYLQYEYFNYHMNKTFFWDNVCMMNHQNMNRCLPKDSEETADGFYVVKKSFKEWCRVWGGTSRGRSFEGAWAALCFDFHLYREMDTEIRFNGQKRDLGKYGSQKWINTPREEARRVCDVVCHEQAGMPRMEDTPQMLSMQWTYELDDMCHGCK